MEQIRAEQDAGGRHEDTQRKELLRKRRRGNRKPTQQEGLNTQQAATTDLILPNMLFFVMLSLQLHILHFPQDILLPVVHF